MLIMITNKCFEDCPHCMECSNPNGQHMDIETFRRAVMFAKFIGSKLVGISGGEPTTHPEFFNFCKIVDEEKMLFVIMSNGTWCLEDSWNKDIPKTEAEIKKIHGFRWFVMMQIYSNKAFYKDYEAIRAKKDYFASYGRITFCDDEIIAMKDLGRAKKCELAQKMCEESKYYMSCANSALVARQVKTPVEYGRTIEDSLYEFCHPMVDFKGDVHLSESWHCQSVGNVAKDPFETIWENIKTYKPCGGCKDCERFFRSDNPGVVHARKFLTK